MTDTRDSQVYRMLYIVVCAIVAHPEDVVITGEMNDAEMVFSIRVRPSDMVALIGREGAVARAIRTVPSGVSAKLCRRFTVVIINPPRADSSSRGHMVA
jgi:predicted RNA-binding protein YlqC (UPF0109 family)